MYPHVQACWCRWSQAGMCRQGGRVLLGWAWCSHPQACPPTMSSWHQNHSGESTVWERKACAASQSGVSENLSLSCSYIFFGVIRLEHSRPGTVSLSIAENDDDPLIKQRPSYSPTEFLITTGKQASSRSPLQNCNLAGVLK